MKLGLHIPDFTWPAGPRTWAQLAEVAIAAEDAGFDRVSVMDHVWQIGHIGPPSTRCSRPTPRLVTWPAKPAGVADDARDRGRLPQPRAAGKNGDPLDVLSGGGPGSGSGRPGTKKSPAASACFSRLWLSASNVSKRRCRLPPDVVGGKALRRPPLPPGPHAQQPPSLLAPPAHPDRWLGRKKDAPAGRPLRPGLQPFCRRRPPHKLDVLRAHCEAEGRPYEDVEKTVGYTFDVGEKGERVGPDNWRTSKNFASFGVQVAHGRVQRVWELSSLRGHRQGGDPRFADL